jgi:hypothetical protein
MMSSSGSEGNTFSTMDYASFVMGELEELGGESSGIRSEPDFATSRSSTHSPSPNPNSPAASSPFQVEGAAATTDCNEIESHLKFLSEDSVIYPFIIALLGLISLGI